MSANHILNQAWCGPIPDSQTPVLMCGQYLYISRNTKITMPRPGDESVNKQRLSVQGAYSRLVHLRRSWIDSDLSDRASRSLVQIGYTAICGSVQPRR